MIRLVSLVALVLLAISPASAQDRPAPLFEEIRAAPGRSVAPRPRPPSVRARAVRVDMSLIGGANGALAPVSRLRLNLFLEIDFVAVLQRFEQTGSGYAWIGKIEGEPLSSVILVTVDRTVSGSVTVPGRTYAVRAADGVGTVSEIEERLLPRSADDAIPAPPEPAPPASGGTDPNVAADDGALIDVAVVYSRTALRGAASEAQLRADIDLAVATTNQAFSNSGVRTRLRQVHTGPIDYEDSSNTRTDLRRLQAPSDGIMDDVHSLRDSTGADLVALITERDDSSCGRAYRLDPDSRSDYGFSVTRRECLPNLTFSHEIGHNLGACHDWYSDGTCQGAFTFSFGHVEPEYRLRTIMAVHDLCEDLAIDCDRIAWFSSPRTPIKGTDRVIGVPAGTDTTCPEGDTGHYRCDADNERTFNEMAGVVARFRASRSSESSEITLTDVRFDRVEEYDSDHVRYWVRVTARNTGSRSLEDTTPHAKFYDRNGNSVGGVSQGVFNLRVWPSGEERTGAGFQYIHTDKRSSVTYYRLELSDDTIRCIGCDQVYRDVPNVPMPEPGRTTPPTLDLTCHGYDEGATRAYNCIPVPSQQRHMRTFVPAVGSACDQGSIAEFPAGRVVFQIRCRDGSLGQSAAWWHSGQGPGFFVKPIGTPRVWVRTSFLGSSVHLSVWCRGPQENLVVNELLGTSWGNDGTNGIYGMAGCREVEVDTAGEDLQWWFAQELAATALTPPRSWEQVTGADSALPAEALQDLATAAELERRWRQPDRWGMNPGQGANTRGAVLTSDDDGGTRLDLRIASGLDDGPDALDGAPLRSATRTSPLTLDLTCHGYNEGAARGTRAYNCIPVPSQQRYMRTFVPAVGSACDRGSIAEFPAGRIVFQIRCRDGSAGQSAAWSYSGQGPAFFEKPVDTPRVGVRTSFSGRSVHLSVWCRGPQENLVVNELLGTSWGNDGTNGIYGMAGCREVEVDTGGGEDLQWWFTQDLAATALTPPRSWEQVSGGGRALPAEARQDLATATELERLWSRPGR